MNQSELDVRNVVATVTYLLLTEFEGRTVSYGPRFSPSIYGPSAKRRGHKSKGNKRGYVTYSTDPEDEVSKIFIISLLCGGFGKDFHSRGTASNF